MINGSKTAEFYGLGEFIFQSHKITRNYLIHHLLFDKRLGKVILPFEEKSVHETLQWQPNTDNDRRYIKIYFQSNLSLRLFFHCYKSELKSYDETQCIYDYFIFSSNWIRKESFQKSSSDVQLHWVQSFNWGQYTIFLRI